MKKTLLVIPLVITLLSSASAADNSSGFGLGVMAGEPTGISFKGWVSPGSAIDGGLAWSFEGDGNIHIHVDYIVHHFTLIKIEKGSLPLYYGIGGRFRFRDDRDDDIGIRIPVGLDYLFANSSFDVFFEVVPILDLAPSTELSFNAAIGGRFFF